MQNGKNDKVGIRHILALGLIFFGAMTLVAVSILIGLLMLVFGLVIGYTEWSKRKANVSTPSEKT